MRLYTFEIEGEVRVGAELPGQERLLDLHAVDPALPSQLMDFIRAGRPALEVSTGTPAGVGVFRKPPRSLKPGDVVRLEAEGIGVLENPVVAA